MDRRSWAWRKKLSERTVTSTASVSGDSAEIQGQSKNAVKYVQISQERYACMSGMEDRVMTLNEKLSTALSDITDKENLVKQHAKVTEEAVSGWEKAEAEALALKNQLESMTLLKLTAEDRAVHLDCTLKECLKQMRNVKEESEKQLKFLKVDSEQKLHDVIVAKTNQWEKAKTDLENKIEVLQQELLMSSAENDIVSRAMLERSNMLMKISEQKTQADAQIEVLKADIQSCEKELSSLKYEVHIVTKELEIRNEEKNISARSAEVANKQHLEDIKKIMKLEAECQRLRGIVRKKLHGPAVLAQMKLEVDSLEKDFVEVRLRKSPAKNSNQRFRMSHGFSHENVQQLYKENEVLASRLLTMEEETNMLKEVLSKCNSELQASRTMFAMTVNIIHGVNSQMVLDQQNTKFNSYISAEGSFFQNEIDRQSLASMSVCGADEECRSESWATVSISDFPHYKKEKTVEKIHKKNNSSQLDFMDDFLEMEKLACLSAKSNGSNFVSNGTSGAKKIQHNDCTVTSDVSKEVKYVNGKYSDLSPEQNLSFLNVQQSKTDAEFNKNEKSLSKLKSQISSVIDSKGRDAIIETLLGDIKRILQGVQEISGQHSAGSFIESNRIGANSGEQKDNQENSKDTTINAIRGDCVSSVSKTAVMSEDLKKAVSEIHNVVVSLGKEAIEMSTVPSVAYGLGRKIGEFSYAVDRFVSIELGANDFILVLSCALSQTTELTSKMSYSKRNIGECNASYCVDKVTLSENKVQHEPSKETFSDPSLESEVQEQLGPGIEAKNSFLGYPIEDCKRLKEEKECLGRDLKMTKCQLSEAEQQLTMLNMELVACQNSKSLADTQLKCMAESYKLLESRCQELQAEIKLLQTKTDNLENKLQEEKYAYQDDLAKLKDVQEEMERKEQCFLAWEGGVSIKSQKHKEIAAAAEKLVECQETIFLLDRQLKALNPQEDLVGFALDENRQTDGFVKDIFISNIQNTQGVRKKSDNSGHGQIENIASILQKRGDESPFDDYSSQFCPSDTEASSNPKSPVNSKRPKHRSTWSTSSLSNPAKEKHGRGISRFFSNGRSEH